MSAETNKQVARRYYDDVLNGRNLDVLEELAVQDYQEHGTKMEQATGLAGLRERVMNLTTALDPRFTLEDIVAEGDRVAVRWTNSGTHVGDLPGIPATGKSFTISGTDFYRFQGDKMAEHWDVVDQLALLQQLGLIPSPESAG